MIPFPASEGAPRDGATRAGRVTGVVRPDLDAGLKMLGFDTFRPGQRESIETLLDVGRLLLVAPTGGGKSLIYQLPAAVLPGTTLVISPLISLMNDQVSALAERGVPATYLASTLSPEEMRARLSRTGNGAYKLVYVAPERLRLSSFRTLAADLDCPLVAVDEAHCISEWGHDFRREYLEIGDFVATMPSARLLACTATATPIVRDEILSRLGMEADTPQIVRGFARPNLALRVVETRTRQERLRCVDRVLAEALGAPGAGRGTAIVYAPTRKATEEEAARLTASGWASAAYHAGMSGPVRESVQDDFLTGAVEVTVATNAFGMGIDRADVRAVVHLAPPGSIESYYQEVGRAGRDGDDAIGLLVISPGDLPLRRRLIEGDGASGGNGPDVIAHKWNLFLELMRWAEGGSCRHDAILRYFGDEAETLSGCGRCDVCLDLNAPDAPGGEDVSIVVRKALSAVARLRGRFGLTMAVKLLRGVSDDRLRRAGLDRTKTFGTLADRSDDWLTRLLRRCVTAGWVDFAGGDRPVVILTEAGRATVLGDHPVRLKLPSEHVGRGVTRARAAARRAGSAAESEEALDERAQRVFDALRAHRLALATAGNVPPYVIASDRALRDLARLRPRTPEEMLVAHGIGPAKVERYAEGFLQVIERASTDA